MYILIAIKKQVCGRIINIKFNDKLKLLQNPHRECTIDLLNFTRQWLNGRASASQAEGCGFDPRLSLHIYSPERDFFRGNYYFYRLDQIVKLR